MAGAIRISAIAALVLAGMLPWMGCHRKPAMMRIWGKVSLDGKPIEDGQVIFTPIEGTTGPMVAGDIVRGQYETARAVGLLPGGVYRVEIVEASKAGAQAESSGEPPLAGSATAPLALTACCREAPLVITVSGNPKENQRDFLLSRSPSP